MAKHSKGAKNPFEITCKKVQAKLEDYLKTPEKLSQSLIGKISYHLTRCPTCQEKFVEIREQERKNF